MNSTEFQSESELFRAAAELLRLNANGDDRRGSPRHKYDALISVAPYVGGKTPAESLIPVRCKDISRSGISFVSRALDSEQLLLVQLNVEPPVKLVARVIRQLPADDLEFATLVSCQFISKA